MKLVYLALALEIILTACGTSSVPSNNSLGGSNCSQQSNSVACQNASGCYWVTTPGTGGGSGCQSIMSCNQAMSSASCKNATNTCGWDGQFCNDTTKAIPVALCSSITDQASCMVSYQTAAFCGWFKFGSQYSCFAVTSAEVSPSDPCTFTGLKNICTAISTCTWGQAGKPCAINAPLFCAKFSGNVCCPAGALTCTQTDPNCIATPESTLGVVCTDRADAICTPNSASNPTACCSGLSCPSSTSVSSPGCSLGLESCHS